MEVSRFSGFMSDFLNGKHLEISHLQIWSPQFRPFLQACRAVASAKAEKPGSDRKYFALLHAFFRFFGVFSVASSCLSMTTGDPTPSKKIVPKTLP
jgi:hypothetical protein